MQNYEPMLPMPTDLKEPQVSENGLVALEKRYLLKDENGNLIETPKQLFWRVASAVAIVEKNYPKSKYYDEPEKLALEFYNMMADMKFLPNSPTLMNAGLPDGQLSACFVLPIEDNMESIFGTLKDAAMIFKSGGGVGFSFSRLRAKDSMVSSTQGVASGPVSFMKIYDSAIEQIKQGGKRRGAAMGILRVDHPDILEFITCKHQDGDISNFNISVAVTDAFMEAVKNNEEYELICPATKQVVNKLNAKDVFAKLVYSAWFNADPGIVFIDTVNKDNPLPQIGDIEATNPCFSGDTLVAVADGREAISIKELAAEGKDVPVYTLDEKGDVCIKMGRNPRMTGATSTLLRVEFDNGSYIDVTPNHKFLIQDSIDKEAKDLEIGDRLFPLTRKYYNGNKLLIKKSDNMIDAYVRLVTHKTTGIHKEHRMIYQFFNPDIDISNLVIHHKNHIKDDNRIENLCAMTDIEHKKYHANLDNNIFKNDDFQKQMREKYHIGAKRSDVTKRRISEARFALYERDPEARNRDIAKGKQMSSDPEISRKGKEGRRNFLLDKAKSQTDLPIEVVKQIDGSERMFVVKNCELCGKEFKVFFGRREQAYCSHKCASSSPNVQESWEKRRHNFTTKKENIKAKQLEIFRDFEKEYGNAPGFHSFNAFAEKYKEEGVSYKLRNGYKNIKEVKQALKSNNHKVVNVYELEKSHPVYNITIDQTHTLFAIGGFGVDFDKNNMKDFVLSCNCGEEPLLSNNSCNLGSINLSKFAQEDIVDLYSLTETIKLATHFLDNVVDASIFPIEEISKMVKSSRPLGLGYMGFADLLYQLKKPYDPENSDTLSCVHDLFSLLKKESYSKSIKLAAIKGTYPYASLNNDNKRNCQLLTMAPTGTLSLIAGCSSGVEPLFALAFTKNILEGEKLLEVNPIFQEYINTNLPAAVDDIIEHIGEHGTISNVDWIDEKTQNIFMTAQDIPPKHHVLMQATIQKYVDAAISKTINMPANATEQDVYDAYVLAYETGCKGITVYRDGCKEGQVLTTGKTAKTNIDNNIKKERPSLLNGFTECVKTGMGNMYVTVNEVDCIPVEVFAIVGKSGKSIAAKAEAIGRLVSLSLRNGVDVLDIISQLKGIGGENPVFEQEKQGLVLSIPDGISWVLEKHYGGTVKQDAPIHCEMNTGCPECGNDLVNEEGCKKCYSCGFSRCG